MIEPVFKKIQTKHGTFHAIAEDLITEQLISFSAHTRNELSMVLDHINSNDIILDIGAHIGTYSIPMAQKATSGKVYSIEAALSSYNLLSKNIEENGLEGRIEPYHFLAAGRSLDYTLGEITERNTGANYYVPGQDDSNFKGTSIQEWIDTLEEEKFSFIKLDIEGMEFQVLSSLEDYLIRHRPKLYIEIVEDQLRRQGNTPLEIQTLLDDIGYTYYVNTYHRNSNEDHYIKTEIDNFGYSKFFDVLAIPI